MQGYAAVQIFMRKMGYGDASSLCLWDIRGATLFHNRRGATGLPKMGALTMSHFPKQIAVFVLKWHRVKFSHVCALYRRECTSFTRQSLKQSHLKHTHTECLGRAQVARTSRALAALGESFQSPRGE